MIGPGGIAGSALANKGNAVDKTVEFLYGQQSMSHRFRVAIDDEEYNLGTWSTVGGLSVDWTPNTYRCGDNNLLHILPGGRKFGTVTLERAACSESATVKKWLEKVTMEFQPLSGAIVMLNFLQQEVVRWDLWEFFPIGWSIGGFDAGSTRPSVEVLRIAHTGFLDDRVKTGEEKKGGQP